MNYEILYYTLEKTIIIIFKSFNSDDEKLTSKREAVEGLSVSTIMWTSPRHSKKKLFHQPQKLVHSHINLSSPIEDLSTTTNHIILSIVGIF